MAEGESPSRPEPPWASLGDGPIDLITMCRPPQEGGLYNEFTIWSNSEIKVVVARKGVKENVLYT